jgi:hypothetical protein
MIYGNPSYESVQAIKNSILVREWNRLGVFDELKLMPYPDEVTTQKELWYLVESATTVDEPRMKYIERVDRKLYEVMSEYLASYGVTVSWEEIKQQLDMYEPIIDYLKVIYNRPRPFQSAGVYGIPLYPRLKTDASDSSYPGGHTLLSLFFRHIYMASHPELARPLMQFVLDVALTREQGGVHHPSDNLFSMRIYKHLKPWMIAQTKVYTHGLDKLSGY